MPCRSRNPDWMENIVIMKFTYTGPDSAITLKLADGTEQDVLLFSGKDVDVPADHDAVQVLVARGLLAPTSDANADAGAQ